MTSRLSIWFLEAILALSAISKTQWAAGYHFNCQPTRSRLTRPHSVSITEFGAVGDGVTLNTKAFQNAIFYLHSFADKGGAQLFVPAGRWLTGSFSLISHLTLSLDKDAVIIGSMDSTDWPIIDPLPSYGRGRELPGGRHQSLIHGYNLTDIVITGDNGTVDGQGGAWWNWYNNGSLDYTRPHLIELMYSTGLIITNLTFVNSPYWTIHPVYCSQVLIQNVTILAPSISPNTDGIDPDSSTNVCIKGCYISTGGDAIAIKSGWDEYGILYGRPSFNISIVDVTAGTKAGAGIALGSEMSGGIAQVHAEHIQLHDSKHGIRIKTSRGRGGYILNVFIYDVVMENVEIAIRIQGNYGEHPDENYDPSALPVIEKITIKDVLGMDIGHAGLLEGIQGDNFSDLCLSNVTFHIESASVAPWKCSFIQGYSNQVSPETCELLQEVPEGQPACYPEVLHRIVNSRYEPYRLLTLAEPDSAAQVA